MTELEKEMLAALKAGLAIADMLAALTQILARSISNQNDDLKECKRQLFHIECLARAAIAKAEGRPAMTTPERKGG